MADKGLERSITRLNAREKKAIVALLCVAVSAAAAIPFFFLGHAGGAQWLGASAEQSAPAPTNINGSDDRWGLHMPETHDLPMHFQQMRSFYRGLETGDLYPRWEEDANRGFGAPTTNYYPPGVYYLTSALHWVVGDWMRVLLDAHLILMIAAAAAMYLYARRFMSRLPAVIAMCAYAVLPYHIIDQYQRGAFAELLSFVWMPLILLFVDRLLGSFEMDDEPHAEGNEGSPPRRPATATRLLDAAGLAAAYGAFLWSHVPTAYQFTLILAVYIPFLVLRRRNWKGVLLVGGAMLLGLGLASAYIYPAAVEQDLIRHGILLQLYPYDTTYFHSDFKQISPAFGEFRLLIDDIWLINAGAVALGAIALFAFKHKPQALIPQARRRAMAWILVGAFAGFMMTKASSPLGRIVPKLDIGVFSWRMLSITTLVAALLAGMCVQAALGAVREQQPRRAWISGAAATLILCGGAAFSLIWVALPMRHFATFSPDGEHLDTIIIPRTAPEFAEDLPVVDAVTFLGKKGQAEVARWDPEHRVIQAMVGERDRAVIRTFNFPGWTLTVDDKPAAIETFGVLGAIAFPLEPGQHRIALDFRNTTPRRVGTIITFSSLALLVVLLVIGKFTGRLPVKVTLDPTTEGVSA